MVIVAFVDPAEFVAVMVYDAEPAVVGVPLITQDESTESPAGRPVDVQLIISAPLSLKLPGLIVSKVPTVPEEVEYVKVGALGFTDKVNSPMSTPTEFVMVTV